ncbi:2Fe-2S iron-sulfur cluster-binding protein [Streptomyces sp. Ncost-T10-10d]|uniref:2Fe-2S iron-sulfur cluster-binding protein n=1 Tax=Streptomyces sp. Ncost-T10-10d TaxID=1839774 RepID=UPI00081EC579|nr:2Fe-2S iron-sulfur cluster-binding protein [Streptomyces sp. Ncost-T10-10d]SCF57466.1 Aerobic-type carbon monoxide dehydrogenase, small subunit, CoxS/CutS family [Streptomyces sp. Ncost-T10-10d]
MTRISMTVDGTRYEDEVEPGLLLVHYLRDHLGLTGTPVGCDTSNCGACTVELDGDSVKSCSVLAVQADGGEVTTVQGLAPDGEWTPLQTAFHEQHALQCGYCIPGVIMTARDLLAQGWAVVGIAALVRRDDDHIAEARIGLTNMGTTPLRASATEQALTGAEAGPAAVARAAEAAAEGTRPASDLSASPEYREHLVRVLTRRAVLAAAGME